MINQPHAISHKTTTTIIFSRVMFMKNTTITFTHFVIIPKPYGNTMHVMLVSVTCHKITHQKVAEAFGQRDSSYTFVSLGSQSIYLHIYILYPDMHVTKVALPKEALNLKRTNVQ